MIKVLHVITSLSADGAQRMLLRVASSMDKQRFDNQVVSLETSGALRPAFEAAGLGVDDLGMRRGVPGVLSLAKLRRIIREFQPDIIQGWMYHGNLAAYLGRLLSGSKAALLWNIRRALYDLKEDKFLTRTVIRIGAFLSPQAQAIIHCANLSQQQHEAIGFEASKSKLIFNGFDISKFSPNSEARKSLRDELGVDEQALLIGTVGRFHPQKDFGNLISASGLVSKALKNAYFVLIGKGVDKNNPEITRWIDQAGVAQKVFLLGERSDVEEILPALDVYCSSSCNEGFPNVVGEAMSCGVPCVVTDAGGSRELVGTSGVVVERRNAQQLADALIYILGLPTTERQTSGMAARESILSNYSLPATIQAYESLYAQFAKGH